jgi:uncharacterized membrane protein YdfJ with MMPL/SSD domain
VDGIVLVSCTAVALAVGIPMDPFRIMSVRDGLGAALTESTCRAIASTGACRAS